MTELSETRQGCGPAKRRLPAEPGVWVFIAGDLLVFGFLFVVYLSYRDGAAQVFDRSQRTLVLGAGALNTILLLTSSLCVVLALRAARTGDKQSAPRCVIGAAACGVAFCGVKAFEYHREIVNGHTPSSNHFYLLYFVLTGLHLVHVLLGLGILAFMYRLTRHADVLSPLGTALLEGCACFWHLVDLLWIFLFPLLYLVR